MKIHDVVVVGGGPAGATAATDLASEGYSVMLLDRPGRIKPCGGAIPPRLIRDFAIPDHLLVARARSARMISPKNREVDMPIDGGFVGMVDRADFDEWLRERAVRAGAVRVDGQYQALRRDEDGKAVIEFAPHGSGEKNKLERVGARIVVGADGARSRVALDAMPETKPPRCVFAYHEIIQSPETGNGTFDPGRCDVYYQGRLSPDFYAWIFPHGATTSIGTGSAHKGFSLRGAVSALRRQCGMVDNETVRTEGAPIPYKVRKRWDNRNDVILAGDAAGAVAPSSGEGIYYAMRSGRLAGGAVAEALESGDSRALALARKRFMKENRRIFQILGMMQWFWYSSDQRRERFVSICRDPDVQRLTWQAYMNKKLVKAKPLTHSRIFFKDLAHLLRVVSP
ncbi:MAG: geranylgeranyl diphosphate reductase [Rhodospirillaceae bacterium]|nr:geranylgeranyl diphosphate reductase [Rhodospirillaceae bacterium]MCY4311479.1 geranylgeranyl diphosphate reductase [Rhodospirillaceae bacterium]